MTKTARWSKRVLCVVLCVLCLTTMLSPVLAVEEETNSPWDTYTAVVRNGAAYSAYPIGKVMDGTRLTVLEQRGEFYKIDCYDMTGYIAASQVELRENEEYYVNCDPESDETEALTFRSQAQVEVFRETVLGLAKAQLGTPYVFGGSRPGGFDCAGLTQYLYGRLGYSLLRTSSRQLRDGVIVAKEDLQVGDLVFFRTSYETAPTSHVGIYAGDGKIIHAGSKGVCYADLDGSWFADYYLCSRRVVCPVATGFSYEAVVTAVNAGDYRRSTGALRTAGKHKRAVGHAFFMGFQPKGRTTKYMVDLTRGFW